MRTAKKLGLAAVVVFALFAGFAAPAGATRPVEIVSGTLTTVLGNFDLTPGSQGTPPCPEKPDTLAFTTTLTTPGPPPTGTWTLNGTFSGQFQFPPLSGNWFQADFTILPGSGGTWTGATQPPPTPSTQPMLGTIGVQVRIYQLFLAGQPVNCQKNNLRCIISGVFRLQSTSTYKTLAGNPGLPTTTTGDLVTIDAATGPQPAFPPLSVSSCSPPWNAVGGTNAQITNLQARILPPPPG
jgi:hypothetical protein